MAGRIEGRTAVVTGGCSGIGLATVRRFVEEGARVVIGDIDDAGGEALVAELGGPDVATYVHVDVTSKDEVDALFRTAKDTYGSVDIAFNNAGISPPEDDSILDTDLDAWRKVQEVNLTSVYLCCKAALPYMLEQKRGSIINTASFVAVMGAATSQISYSASKGGVLSMSRELGVQFAREGVRVNALCPGPVNTPAAQGAVRQRRRARRAPARARADGPLRRARGDGQRRAVPRLRRVQLHDGQHVPRRRRHLGRLRHAALRPSERRGRTRRRADDVPPGGRVGRVEHPRRPAAHGVRRRGGGRGRRAAAAATRRGCRAPPRGSCRGSTRSSSPAARTSTRRATAPSRTSGRRAGGPTATRGSSRS